MKDTNTLFLTGLRGYSAFLFFHSLRRGGLSENGQTSWLTNNIKKTLGKLHGN